MFTYTFAESEIEKSDWKKLRCQQKQQIIESPEKINTSIVHDVILVNVCAYWMLLYGKLLLDLA